MYKNQKFTFILSAAFFIVCILVFAPISTACLSGVTVTPDLKCDFIVDNVEIDVNQTATFTCTACSDGGTIVESSWNFGDGTSDESGAIVTHAYSEPGIYTVTHSVMDNFGKLSINQKDIIVRESLPVESLIQSTEQTEENQDNMMLENMDDVNIPETQETALNNISNILAGSYAQATF